MAQGKCSAWLYHGPQPWPGTCFGTCWNVPRTVPGRNLIEGLGWWSATPDSDSHSNAPSDQANSHARWRASVSSTAAQLLRIAGLQWIYLGRFRSLPAPTRHWMPPLTRMTGGARNPPNLRISRRAAQLLVGMAQCDATAAAAQYASARPALRAAGAVPVT